MPLSKLARIIYEKGSAGENTIIEVRVYSTDVLLWSGKAKDLENSDLINKGWLVVEILIDPTDTTETPSYNKRKIITVI